MEELKQSQKPVPKTVKEGLYELANNNINGVQISNETKYMLAGNYSRLMELKTKNENLYKEILGAQNRQTTFMNIINNSTAGLELGKDFHLVNFKGSIAEIKTGYGWKALAEKFSTKPIKMIKVIIISKYDTSEFGWDEENECQVLKNYVKDVSNPVYYNDIQCVYGVVKFEDGTKRTRILPKYEIDKMRNVSPSANKTTGELSPNSPWNQWPMQMVEGKAYRDLIKREIVLDHKLMSKLGYNFIEDETPVQIVKSDKGNNVSISNDDSVYNGANAFKPVKETVVEVLPILTKEELLVQISKKLNDTGLETQEKINSYLEKNGFDNLGELEEDKLEELLEILNKEKTEKGEN